MFTGDDAIVASNTDDHTIASLGFVDIADGHTR